MFWTLIRREILMNLMTFRFLVAILACLSLVLSSSVVLTSDYTRRLANYNTAITEHHQRNFSARTYSYLSVYLDRPPNPLSIFNQGLDTRTANVVQIQRGKVPYLWKNDYRSTDYDNPFRHLLAELDIVSLFQVLLSLLALVFAYDAITGEREAGTLRLMLANPMSRGFILFSKYVGAMTCLLVPFFVSFLLALLLQLQSGVIPYTNDDALRIGGIFVTTLIYVSTFYLVGLLISSTMHRTATSLIFSVFVWMVFTLLYPNMSLFMVNRFVEIDEKLEQVNREIDQIWEQFDREKREYPDPLASASCRGWRGTDEGRDCREIALEFEPEIPAAKAYYKSLVPLRIRTAETVWQARKQALLNTYIRKSNMAQNTLRFSPAGLYQLTTEAWAGTSLFDIENFFVQARQYRQTVIDYFYDKNAFSSRQWFASDKGTVSWEDLPRFSYQRLSAWDTAARALPDLLLLALLNLLLFFTTFLIFIRQEV